MSEQPQLPLPIDQAIITAQKRAGSPVGENKVFWEVPDLRLVFNEHDAECWRQDDASRMFPCPAGCVLVKSKSLGNFLATSLGWEHFPIRADGTAATPHYAPWASAVHLP
jgi:hypothetical protein